MPVGLVFVRELVAYNLGRMSHVIVCGLGQVGYRCTLLLRRLGIPVVIVTETARAEFIKEVIQAGAEVIYGDARDIDVLHESRLDKAQAVLAVTSSDLTNLEIGMDVVESGVTARVVLRLFDQTLATRLHKQSGIHRTLAMSIVAAPNFAAAALDPSVIGAFEWKGESFSLVETSEVVTGDRVLQSGLVARPRQRVHTRRSPGGTQRLRLGSLLRSIPKAFKVALLLVFILSVISVGLFCRVMNLTPVDSIYFVVTTLTTTGYGDITVKDSVPWVKLYACAMMILGSAAVAVIYSIITDYIVSTRFDELAGKQSVRDSGHVIVVGLGNVGTRVIEQLSGLGTRIVAIDQDSAARDRKVLPGGVQFLIGDGREPEVLERAGISRASAIIATTENDATNLSVGLAAKRLRPKLRAVVRLFDASFARKVEGVLNIDAALSASRLSAPSFVGAALFDEMVYSFSDDSKLTVIQEVDGSLKISEHSLCAD